MEYMHLLKILTILRYIVRVRHFSNLPFAYCKNCSLALPWTLLHDSNSGGGPLFSKEQSVLSQVIRNSKGQNIRKGKKLITAGVTKIKYSLQKSRVFKMNLNPRVYRRKKSTNPVFYRCHSMLSVQEANCNVQWNYFGVKLASFLAFRW